MRLIDVVNKYQRRLVVPLGTYPILKECGKTAKDVLTDSDQQMVALKKISEKIPTDMVLSFMDLSVESEALGLNINFSDKTSPQVTEHPIKNEEELAKLAVPDPQIAGRMPVYINVQKLMTEEFDIMTGSYVASPFTLAGLLMGAEDLAMNTIMKPEFCHKTLEFTVDVIKAYANALVEAGADFIVVLDPTAVLLSAKSYEEFILPYNKKLFEQIDAPIVLHTCGNTKHLLPHMGQTGAQALSLDALVDMKEAAKIVSDDIVLMGNLDPVRIFKNLTKEEVYQKAKDQLADMKEINNFVLSSGCDLPYETKIENIIAFCNAALDEE